MNMNEQELEDLEIIQLFKILDKEKRLAKVLEWTKKEPFRTVKKTYNRAYKLGLL